MHLGGVQRCNGLLRERVTAAVACVVLVVVRMYFV